MRNLSVMEIPREGALQITWIIVCATNPRKVLIPNTRAYFVFKILMWFEKNWWRMHKRRGKSRKEEKERERNLPECDLSSCHSDQKVNDETKADARGVSNIDVVGDSHQKAQQCTDNIPHHENRFSPSGLNRPKSNMWVEIWIQFHKLKKEGEGKLTKNSALMKFGSIVPTTPRNRARESQNPLKVVFCWIELL